jgi:hypothetical protein
MAQAAFVTDVAQPYGADFVLTYNGDLALIQDTLDTPAATIQQLIRLCLTNPVLQDVDALSIGRPDNLFDGNYGAGLPIAVGEPITPALANGIVARILAALANSPSVSQTPAPSVTAMQGAAPFQNVLYVSVVCNTVSGQTVVIPSLPVVTGG